MIPPSEQCPPTLLLEGRVTSGHLVAWWPHSLLITLPQLAAASSLAAPCLEG